jgi:hypothetical protein
MIAKMSRVFDAAAEIGVAAFMAGDSAPSDEVVVADLERSGVEPWLARRLNAFLPLAFGRRLLDGIAVSDTFVDGNGARRLEDDPVYPWVAARAMQADRAEVERIGLRSSEIDAVNQALHAGVALDAMALGPAALSETLPPPGDGDGGVPSAVTTFEGLLAAQGFPVSGGRLGSMEVGGAVRAHPRPTPDLVMAQVSFAVRHPELAAGSLVESFTGVGPTWRDAIAHSTLKFERSVLHPLVAGLVDRTALAEHVAWQTWQHPGGPFHACLGPRLVMVEAEAEPPELDGVLDAVRTALERVPLTRAVHALRIVVAYDGGGSASGGVLLDGDLWPDGAGAMSAAPPATTTGPMEIQQYALLLPA